METFLHGGSARTLGLTVEHCRDQISGPIGGSVIFFTLNVAARVSQARWV